MSQSSWFVSAMLLTVMLILATVSAEKGSLSSDSSSTTSSTEFIFTVASNGFTLDNFKMNLHMYFGQLANDPALENLKQSTDNQGDTVLAFSFGGDSAKGYTDGVVNFCTNNDCNDAATTPMGQQFQSSGMPLYSISVIHHSQTTTAPPPATTSAPPPPPSTSFDFTMADAGFTITKFIAALESYFKLGQVSVNGHSATQGPMLHYTFTFSGATAKAYTDALVAYCDNKNNDCGVNPQKLILAFEEQELQLYFIYVITPTTAAPPTTPAPTTTLPPTTLPPTAAPTTSAPTTAVPTTPTPTTQAPTTVAPTTAAPTPQPTTTHAPTPSPTPSPNLVNFYTDCSTNQCELATCTDTTFTPYVCVGSEGFGFSFNCSNDNKCAELQVFSDDECLERTEESSLVCGSCNRGGANVNNTYYRVDCDGNQSLSIHRFCDPTCTTCKNDGGVLHFPANTCSGSLPEKGWPHLAVGEIRDCQAVRLSTFSDAKCAAPIESSVLEQGMCDNNGKSTVICPGFKRLPAPVFPPVVTLPKTTAPPSPPPSPTAAPTTESPTETPLPTTTFEPTPVPSGTMAPPSPPAPLVTFNATFTSESFVTNFPTTLHAMYHNYRFKVVWEDGSDEKQEEVATLSVWKTFWFMGANGPYLAEQMLNMSTAVLKDQYGITALSEATPETDSPTTGEPTTQGPPTEAPTSQPPSPPTTTSGVIPTSQSPSTTNPGTHHPTTQVPATTTTESPTSMEPTATSTQRPTTQAPPTTVSPTGSPATPPTLPPLPPATSHTTFSGLWQTVTMYDNFPSSVHQYFPDNTFRVTMGGDRVVAHDGTVTDTFHFGGDKKDVDALNEEFVLYSEKKKTAPAYFGLEELSYVAAATPTPKPTSPPPAKSNGLSAGDIGAIVACVLFVVLVGLIAVVKLNGRKKNALDEAAMVDHLNSTMVTRYDAEED